MCAHAGKNEWFSLFQFRAGRTRILVATDVAARGLDIPNVAHVINCVLQELEL